MYGFLLGQVQVVCHDLMAFFTRITVHMFYRIMGLAMHICKVLSIVQVDPKSFRRTASIHMHTVPLQRECVAYLRTLLNAVIVVL